MLSKSRQIDVITKRVYNVILIESSSFMQNEKGLKLLAWCNMTNFVHLKARAVKRFILQDILHVFKKFTGNKIFTGCII